MIKLHFVSYNKELHMFSLSIFMIVSQSIMHHYSLNDIDFEYNTRLVVISHILGGKNIWICTR